MFLPLGRRATLTTSRTTTHYNHANVRHLNVYVHATGVPGFKVKPMSMFEWQQYDITPNTETSSIWLRRADATKWDHHKVSQLPAPAHDTQIESYSEVIKSVSHGRALIRNNESTDSTLGHFYIAHLFPNKEAMKKSVEGSQRFLPSQIHIKVETVEAKMFWMWLKRAYASLERGMVVQVHYHMDNKASLDVIMCQNPQLWPTVIARAMPEGTGLLMLPWTDGNQIVWSMTRDPQSTQIRMNTFLRHVKRAPREPWLKKRPPRIESLAVSDPEKVPVFMYDEKRTIPSVMDAVFDYQVQAVRRALIGSEQYSTEGKEFSRAFDEAKRIVSMPLGVRKRDPKFAKLAERYSEALNDPNTKLTRR